MGCHYPDHSAPTALGSHSNQEENTNLRLDGMRLREADRKQTVYALIFRSAPDALVMSDSYRRITDWNPAAEKMFGTTTREAIGRPPDFMLGSEATDGPSSPDKVYRYNRPDGSQGFLSCSTTEMFDSNGETLGSLSILRDITALRMAGEEKVELLRAVTEAYSHLQEAQARSVETAKLQALGELAAGIAHDFNNALSAIIGFAELLQEQPDRHLAAKYLDGILVSATDAAQVVRRIQDFSRPRELTESFEFVDANKIVDDVAGLTRHKWNARSEAQDHRIELRVVQESTSSMLANPSEIRELLTNLVFNAVEAMPGGGAITLRADSDAEWVRISVSDTGIGIPADVLPRLFDPFFTTKGAQGNGLGLSVCHGIARRHGGCISVDSEPGKGATFTIYVPRADSAKGSFARGHVSPAPPLRILVVDDEEAVRLLLSDALVSAGHWVESASSGHAALDRFRSGRYDLIIADRGMDGMSGDDLARAIKGIAPNKPVILLTSWADVVAARQNVDCPVERVLGKPISVRKLLNAIDEVMNMRSMRTADQ